MFNLDLTDDRIERAFKDSNHFWKSSEVTSGIQQALESEKARNGEIINS